MLDISLFRADRGGDPELVRESQRRRFADVGLVDAVLAADAAWREARGRLDGMKMEFNRLVAEVKRLRLAKEDPLPAQEASKAMKGAIKAAEDAEAAAAAARDAALLPIGNIVHDSVPVSADEADNAVVREVGERRVPAPGERLWSHVDLVQMLGCVDLDAGAAVAGSRGYYLKGPAVLLNQALISYALAYAGARGAEPVHTPFFMRKEVMAECAQLAQFDEELYKVVGDGDEKYLIATSEQTLCALHRGQWVEPKQLPLRYAGFSTCFRKEAGSHGRDTAGIFRVHQFEKVEQFSVTSPHGGASWAEMDAMLATAEGFYASLGVAYRVVNIVSGELNAAAAKKYDLEAWFPGSAAHRELVSCSNCTDYQSRRLGVRLRSSGAAAAAGGAGAGAGGGEDGGAPSAAGKPAKEYVHMLNATLTATERTLCCLLETHQRAGGVAVPEPLRPFCGGAEFFPFKFRLDAKGRRVPLE